MNFEKNFEITFFEIKKNFEITLILDKYINITRFTCLRFARQVSSP